MPGRIRYDNLKAAVEQVLKGRDRVESDRFIALRSHYGFDSFFCQPGIKGSHEKGGVEGEVGRFRRRHLVPVPRVDSMAELNELLAAGDGPRRPAVHRPAADHRRPSTSRSRPTRCGALPAEPFDVTRRGRASGGPQEPGLGPWLPLLGPGLPRRRACSMSASAPRPSRSSTAPRSWPRHARARKGDEVLVLDHYLEVLAIKPGAFPGATALARARAAGVFGADP